MRPFKKAMDDNFPHMSEKSIFTVLKLIDLNETLINIRQYKIVGIASIVEKYKRKLEKFEDFLDSKYWNEDAVFYMWLAISCGVVDTLEEAINMYENYKLKP